MKVFIFAMVLIAFANTQVVLEECTLAAHGIPKYTVKVGDKSCDIPKALYETAVALDSDHKINTASGDIVNDVTPNNVDCTSFGSCDFDVNETEKGYDITLKATDGRVVL